MQTHADDNGPMCRPNSSLRATATDTLRSLHSADIDHCHRWGAYCRPTSSVGVLEVLRSRQPRKGAQGCEPDMVLPDMGDAGMGSVAYGSWGARALMGSMPTVGWPPRWLKLRRAFCKN